MIDEHADMRVFPRYSQKPTRKQDASAWRLHFTQPVTVARDIARQSISVFDRCQQHRAFKQRSDAKGTSCIAYNHPSLEKHIQIANASNLLSDDYRIWQIHS